MNELPFSSIEAIPEQFTGTNVIARFVEALGFRYRWATEGLSSDEYLARPVEGSMNILELMEHLYSMAKFTNYSLCGEKSDDPAQSFDELRLKTLIIYEEIVQRLKSTTDSEFESKEKFRMENGATSSFWLMLNGPISDSLTHVGQITSWRRIAGNPLTKGIDVFRGKTNF